MAEGKSGNRWSELNDAEVIAVMLSSTDSEYWGTCSEFVRYLIEKHFSKLPLQLKEEIAQDIMLQLSRNLATFRWQSKFTTWLVSVVRNRTIDVLRRQANIKQWEVYTGELPETHEESVESAITHAPKTPEELVLAYERIYEARVAVREFVRMHAKSQRNGKILQMVFYDGYSQEETAKILGVPAPVVGYVVRSARAYIRQKLAD
jgi:RNA polymerase sigma-70 factor (ECF subfamily)